MWLYGVSAIPSDVPEKKTGLVMSLVPPLVFEAVAIGIALAIYKCGDRAAYAARIAEVVASEQHWTYASVALLGFTVRLINFYPLSRFHDKSSS